MSVETVIALFVALFGSGAGASFFSWLGGRSKRRLSDDETRIAQATAITKTALEMTETQSAQIQQLTERVNTLACRQEELQGENRVLRDRITHLEQSLAAWRVAWRQRLPDEPYPVN